MYIYTAFGVTGNKMQMARHFGVSRHKLEYRLKKGMTMEQALTLDKEDKEKVLKQEKEDEVARHQKRVYEAYPWDMHGVSYLAARTVMAAFRDYREMLMVDIAFAKNLGRRPAAVQKKHESVIRVAKRSYNHFANDLAKGKTRQTLADFVEQKRQVIRANGLSAERFLLSDRLSIFTDIDGKQIIGEAQRQAYVWSKGE